jgi:hypothetical protein
MKKTEIDGACSTYGDVERRKQGFGERPEGKRPLGRLKRKWKDNIKKDLQEVRCGDMEWNELSQERDRWRKLLNEVMNLRVP